MTTNSKRCFIIGPMGNMERFNKIADEIIKPIVTPYNFEVITPLEGVDGHVMHQVLLELERADLLIADISGNNPNVMYELGIFHSFGKAYLTFKDEVVTTNLESTPFDIQSYRYQTINSENVVKSIEGLKSKIENLIERIDIEDYFNNPVTEFYGAPVAEIPTAIGLAKNYKRNFLDQIIPLVFEKNESDDNYKVEIKEDNGKSDRFLSIRQREELKIRIIIPSKLEYSTHDNITHFKESKIIDSGNWAIKRKTRDFGISVVFENDYPVIIDIPTVLATLHNSILRRRNVKEQHISKRDWLDLEQKELERFTRKCQLYKERLSFRFQNKLEIVERWQPLN